MKLPKLLTVHPLKAKEMSLLSWDFFSCLKCDLLEWSNCFAPLLRIFFLSEEAVLDELFWVCSKEPNFWRLRKKKVSFSNTQLVILVSGFDRPNFQLGSVHKVPTNGIVCCTERSTPTSDWPVGRLVRLVNHGQLLLHTNKEFPECFCFSWSLTSDEVVPFKFREFPNPSFFPFSSLAL